MPHTEGLLSTPFVRQSFGVFAGPYLELSQGTCHDADNAHWFGAEATWSLLSV